MSDGTDNIEAFDGAWVRGRLIPAAWNRLSHDVIGAAMKVHSSLGPGLPERVYTAALCHEMAKDGLDFHRELSVNVVYDGMCVGVLRLDLLVGGVLVIEVKAVDTVPDVHLAQLVSYLRAGKYPLGLLINFNVLRLKDGLYRRIHADALPP